VIVLCVCVECVCVRVCVYYCVCCICACACVSECCVCVVEADGMLVLDLTYRGSQVTVDLQLESQVEGGILKKFRVNPDVSALLFISQTTIHSHHNSK